MVTDLFGSLLQDVGKALKINLHPDRNNSCLFKLPIGISVQLEIDPTAQYFVIGSDIGAVPVGKYRESIFREALKANGLPPPRYGIFAYSKQKDHLVLFEMLPLKELTGDRIAGFLVPFCDKALKWKNSIEKGEIPLVVIPESGPSPIPQGIFGLKP